MQEWKEGLIASRSSSLALPPTPFSSSAPPAPYHKVLVPPFTHCLSTLIRHFRFPSQAVSSPPQHVGPRYPVLSQPISSPLLPPPSCPNHTAVFVGPRLAPAKEGSLPQSKSGCMKPPISKPKHLCCETGRAARACLRHAVDAPLPLRAVSLFRLQFCCCDAF
jgi:hypothetical protein